LLKFVLHLPVWGIFALIGSIIFANTLEISAARGI
jgi:hypothetical protein